MELKIEMKDLLKDMKEYTDMVDYLVFVYGMIEEVQPDVIAAINTRYEEQGKAVPKIPEVSE